MAKKRTGDPWMAAPNYGASLTGLDINLLVADVSAAVSFATDVFGAETVYADRDFAVLKLGEMEWMVHADHTFDKHPLVGFAANVKGRGAGAEFCLHGIDPDKTEVNARTQGYTVLASALNKPHGLREAYILDPDGYCWVPDVPLNNA